MTHTAVAPAKPATVRIVKDGMNIFRYSTRNGLLLGSMTYDEWTGTYVAYHGGRYVRRTESRSLAERAMVLGY